MKLYIRQRVFSWRDRFTVRDRDGQDRFYVEGAFFSWGKQLRICRMDGSEAACIRQKLFTFLPRFQIFEGDTQTAEVVKEFSFFHPRYRIEGPDWEVEGSVMAHAYAITGSGRAVASVRKEWLTWGDCYELEIADDRDAITALAAVLCIDAAMENASASVSIST